MKPTIIDNETTTVGFSPFPFPKLPPEIQLRVLEYSDLVGPTRYFVWDRKSGFKLPKNAERGSWRNPGSYFLVSKGFYIKAREVFWKLNTFEVAPDKTPLGKILRPGEDPPNMPTRYTAYDFLGDYVPKTQSLLYLRSLRLNMFPRIRRSAVDEAREKWFQAINYAVRQGLSLSSLHVYGDYLLDQTECEALETTASDSEKFHILRTYIAKDLWPLSIESGPRAVDDLLLECRTENGRVRYRVRRDCQETKENYSDPKWESFTPIQHRLSLNEDSGSGLKDWIEEIWFEKVRRQY